MWLSISNTTNNGKYSNKNNSRKTFLRIQMESNTGKHRVERINSEVEFETCLAQKITELRNNAWNPGKWHRGRTEKDSLDRVIDQRPKVAIIKSKINLGDGLFLLIRKMMKRPSTTDFRWTVLIPSGKIGDYPGISFDSARKISDNHLLQKLPNSKMKSK